MLKRSMRAPGAAVSPFPKLRCAEAVSSISIVPSDTSLYDCLKAQSCVTAETEISVKTAYQDFIVC
eukprot:361602-Pleurochrysis_carterae.AAC.1